MGTIGGLDSGIGRERERGRRRSDPGRSAFLIAAGALISSEFVSLCVSAAAVGYFSYSQQIGFLAAVVGLILTISGGQRARRWTAGILLALAGLGTGRLMTTKPPMSPLLVGLIAQETIRLASAIFLLSPPAGRFVERRRRQLRVGRRK